MKKTPPARLLQAIQEAHGNGSHIARKVVNLLRQTTAEPPASLVDGYVVKGEEGTLLTARECDILNGLAGSNSYQALARSLNISNDMVRFHIRNIYRKLHVHSQSEAVAKALQGDHLIEEISRDSR